MKKCYLLLILLAILITGCQSEDSKMTGSEQIKDIVEIKISTFRGLGGLNEDFFETFTQQKHVNIFKNALEEAVKENHHLEDYDYDLSLNFYDGSNKAVHIVENEKSEIIMKYIGDSTETYIVNSEDSKELIELINSSLEK